MIITELYNGQGIGNQIWCYVVTRSIAKELGLEYGIMSPHKFKGQDFLEIDLGNPVIGGDGPEGGPPNSLPEGIDFYYKETVSSHPFNGVNISKKDYKMLEIGDRTKIDGCMQSLDYLGEIEEIKNWIKTKEGMEINDFSDDNICVVHVRGGDFMGSTSILSGDYYRRAMEIMKGENPNMEFVVCENRQNFLNYEYLLIKILDAHIFLTKIFHYINFYFLKQFSIQFLQFYLLICLQQKRY